MKKVIAIVLSLAAAALTTSLFASAAAAGNADATAAGLHAAASPASVGHSVTSSDHASQQASVSVMESHSHSASPALKSGVSSGASDLSLTVGGESLSASGHSVSTSQDKSVSTSTARGAQPLAKTVQQGATKTRCITTKSGDVEEKVCQFTTISMVEANDYFSFAMGHMSAGAAHAR